MVLRVISYLALSCALLVLPCYALDLHPEQEARAQEVFRSIMSPYCPGRLLSDCPSSLAAELRDKIRERVGRGESKLEIESYLYTAFGEEIRGAPTTEGFGAVAWIAVPIFFLLGLGAVMLWLRATHGKESDSAIDQEEQPVRTPEMERRIWAEVEEG